jgi:hypothetical protein
MKYKLLILVLGLGLILGSCQKFLEETPTGTLTSKATITSAPGGDALVLGPYRSLGNWVDGAEQWGMNLAASLEYWTGKGYSEYMGSILWIYESDGLSGDYGYFINQWNNWYRGVRDCNLSISMLPNVAGLSDEQKSQYIAQVRTLRAFYYFCLVRYYGDVPLITSVVTDITQASQPRSSLKTIYEKVIVPDLEFAIESKLADLPSTGGRITKLTARTILADVYLTMAGYPYQEVKASGDTTKCLTGAWTMTEYPVDNLSAVELLGKAKVQLDLLYGKYTLGTYDDLHDPTKNNKGEAIFQAQFLAGTRNNNIVPFCLPLGSRISAYNDEFGTYIASPAYNASYSPSDKRVQDRQMFFYSDTKAPKHDPNEGPAAKFAVPFLYKWYDVKAIKTNATSSLNWTFYRYADVLLMLTEVNWTLNSLGTSVTEAEIIKGINIVRARALLSAYAGPDITLLTIMGERAYELIFENKMLWDMRRTRKVLKDGVGQWAGIENLVGHQPTSFNYQFNTKHLLAPISSGEIANNANCLQNFGWTPKQVGQN